MAAQPTMAYPHGVRAGRMTWGQAARTFIHNGSSEKRGFRKFLIALRAVGVYGAPVAILDDATFWLPGVNVLTLGNDALLWALIPAGIYSLFRIGKIRKDG